VVAIPPLPPAPEVLLDDALLEAAMPPTPALLEELLLEELLLDEATPPPVPVVLLVEPPLPPVPVVLLDEPPLPPIPDELLDEATPPPIPVELLEELCACVVLLLAVCDVVASVELPPAPALSAGASEQASNANSSPEEASRRTNIARLMNDPPLVWAQTPSLLNLDYNEPMIQAFTSNRECQRPRVSRALSLIWKLVMIGASLPKAR
jgi:hypothetical protein